MNIVFLIEGNSLRDLRSYLQDLDSGKIVWLTNKDVEWLNGQYSFASGKLTLWNRKQIKCVNER